MMALDGTEFIRRFLMHVLPDGFMRVRHYGFLANCHRKAKLTLIQTLLRVATSVEVVEIPGQITSVAQAIDRLNQCPKCHNGYMRVQAEIKPDYKRRQS